MTNTVVRRFDCEFFDQLSAEARLSSRLRQHFNLHASHQDPAQRLFNAIEPGSYIRPHRHRLDPKIETLVAVRGLFTLIVFDDVGNISDRIDFGSAGGAGADHALAAAEIPPQLWHTVISRLPGSILLEIKAGPFDSSAAKEFAGWAPEEGTAEADAYLARLRSLLPGGVAKQ